jgi:hypothetical protein
MLYISWTCVKANVCPGLENIILSTNYEMHKTHWLLQVSNTMVYIRGKGKVQNN